MFKKITILCMLLFSSIVLFAQNENNELFVISPAVGSIKDASIKDSYAQVLQQAFVSAGFANNMLASDIKSSVFDSLIKSIDPTLSAVGKALKARNARYIALVSVDELTRELCEKMKLNYDMVSKFANGIVTVTVFDKNNINMSNPFENAYISVTYGTLEKDTKKISDKLTKDISKQIAKRK